MNKIRLTIAALLGLLGIVCGFSVGISIFAYSIYSIILMFKGTIVVTFFEVLKIILMWGGSGLFGWLTFVIFAFFSWLISPHK